MRPLSDHPLAHREQRASTHRDRTSIHSLKLNNHGLDVRALGDEIGLASAIKMCYASLTKGLTALCTELLTAGIHFRCFRCLDGRVSVEPIRTF